MPFRIEKPHLLLVALLLVSLIIIHDVYSQEVPPLPGEFTLEKGSGWGDASASTRLVINNVTMFPLRFNISGSNQPVFDFSNVEPSTVLSFNQTKASQGSGVWNIYSVHSIAKVKSGPATYSYFSANKTLRLVWTANGTVNIDFIYVSKSLADTITSTISVASLQALFRALSDTVQSIAEITVVAITTISTTVTKVLVYLSETITTTETISILQTLFRTISDSITSSESIAFARGFFASIADSITTSPTISTFSSLIRSISESITIQESLFVQFTSQVSVIVTKVFVYFNEFITTTTSISMSHNLEFLTSIADSITLNENFIVDVVSIGAGGDDSMVVVFWMMAMIFLTLGMVIKTKKNKGLNNDME